MSESRKTALKILSSALKEKNLIKIPSREDSAYLNMLILSSLRQWVDTDSILKQFLSKKLPKKAYNVELILHLAITEILSLNTPDYASINEWVDIAKKESNKVLAGLTNAILHKISQNKEKLQPQLGQHYFTANYLSILKQDYNTEEISQIEQTVIKNAEPPLCLSVKENPQLWAKKLTGEHIANNSIIIRKSGSPTKLEGYNEGSWWVQDIAASLAVTALGNIKDKRVLDLCAAPGGKTAQLINKGAKVTALDISKERLETLKENLHRLHFEAENIVCADAIDYLQNYQGEKFDSIVIDAPCSATGIFRRHPEILLYKTKEDIKKQALLQKQILAQIGNALKTQGTLVYCVCSLSKAEGIVQIRNFLSHNHQFKLIPLTAEEIGATQCPELSLAINKEGCLQTLSYMLPSYGGIDSFFIAKLQKVE